MVLAMMVMTAMMIIVAMMAVLAMMTICGNGDAGDDGDDVAKFVEVLCFVNNGPISTLSQCTQVAFMTFFPKLNQQRAHDIY